MAKSADESFPRRHRIVRSAEFQALYNGGRRLDARAFVLFGRPNDLGHHRLGLTVSRKVGGAVVRNRVKRLFREIFRKASADIPHTYDLVVNARRGCATIAFAELRDDFVSAARKVCR